MNSDLNYLIAQQRADELRRAAESDRLARSIRANRNLAPAVAHWIAQVAAARRHRRPLAASERA